jgi:hypothetical protein
MDVLNLIPDKLQLFFKIIFLFFMFTILLATFAYLLLAARSKIQKLKDDEEKNQCEKIEGEIIKAD